MKEKDFKKIITSYDALSINKDVLFDISSKLINELNKELSHLKIVDSSYSSWAMFNIYDLTKIIINLNVESNVSIHQFIMNSIENSLILNNVEKINRFDNSFIVEFMGKRIELNVLLNDEFTKTLDLSKDILEYNKEYNLLPNTFKIIHSFASSESIDVDPIILFEIFKKVLYKELDNKYFKYLSVLVEGLDDAINNKKYELKYLGTEQLLTNILSDSKVNELKKLRKVLAKASKEEEQELKFDSSKDVLIDVNPIKNDNNTYSWHYEIIDRGFSNTGKESNDYFSTILNGLFKGLKQVVDSQYLTNKNIYIICKENLFDKSFLTTNEAKSRMKTINSLIETNNLKVKQK